MKAMMVLVASLMSVSVMAADIQPKDIDALVKQWSGLQQQQHALNNQWREQQPLLKQQLQLLDAEATRLQALIAANAESQDDVKQQRRSIIEQQQHLEVEQTQLNVLLNRASHQLLTVFHRLPPPLKAQWQETIDQLALTSTTTSDKLTSVIGLLDQFERFNQRIALHQTTMHFDDPQSTEKREYLVDQVFLGVAQGWYISRDGQQVGMGYPALSGWVWVAQGADSQEAHNEQQLAEQRQTVRQLVEMLQRKQTPALLSLPVDLTASGAEE